MCLGMLANFPERKSELILHPPKPARGRTGQASAQISLVLFITMTKALLFLLHLLFISEVEGKHPSTQTSDPWPPPDPGSRAACPLGVRMHQGSRMDPGQQQSTAASPQPCSHSPRGPFPAQSTCTRQDGTVTHGGCHKGKQIKTLTWDSLVALFVLLLVLFVFFPLQFYF